MAVLKVERVFDKDDMRNMLKGKHIILTFTRCNHKAYRILCYARREK